MHQRSEKAVRCTWQFKNEAKSIQLSKITFKILFQGISKMSRKSKITPNKTETLLSNKLILLEWL